MFRSASDEVGTGVKVEAVARMYGPFSAGEGGGGGWGTALLW